MQNSAAKDALGLLEMKIFRLGLLVHLNSSQPGKASPSGEAQGSLLLLAVAAN